MSQTQLSEKLAGMVKPKGSVVEVFVDPSTNELRALFMSSDTRKDGVTLTRGFVDAKSRVFIWLASEMLHDDAMRTASSWEVQPVMPVNKFETMLHTDGSMETYEGSSHRALRNTAVWRRNAAVVVEDTLLRTDAWLRGNTG